METSDVHPKHGETTVDTSNVQSGKPRRNEGARHGVRSAKSKQASAGRPLRRGEPSQEVEREVCPSLGIKHPEEELEDIKRSRRMRTAKAKQYHATEAPRRGHVGVGIRLEPSDAAREHTVPVIHSTQRGTKRSTHAEEGTDKRQQQTPRSQRRSMMVFTPKTGAGSMMADAKSVDVVGSQRAEAARAKQYHAEGAPPRGQVAGGICPKLAHPAGNPPVHSTDSLKRTRHKPRQWRRSSGVAVGTPKCGDRTMMENRRRKHTPEAGTRAMMGKATKHDPKRCVESPEVAVGTPTCGERTMMESRRGRHTLTTTTKAMMVSAPDNSTEVVQDPRPNRKTKSRGRAMMESGRTMSRDQREPRPPSGAMMARVPIMSVAPRYGDRTMMESTVKHVPSPKSLQRASRKSGSPDDAWGRSLWGSPRLTGRYPPAPSPSRVLKEAGNGSSRESSPSNRERQCTDDTSPVSGRGVAVPGAGGWRPERRRGHLQTAAGGISGHPEETSGSKVRHVSQTGRADCGKKRHGSVTVCDQCPVRDSHQVGAAARGSSHQRSEGSLAPNGDWLETRRKEKPLVSRRARVEIVETPSHQRNHNDASTPGRGGIFNRVSQRVETPIQRPARGSGGIALARPNPHIPTHCSGASRSATVQGESEHAVTPLSGDTRSTVWVSKTGVSQQSLPHKAATVWTTERRGDGGQESAQSAKADTSALVAAILDDEEAPLGTSRNATQTQQSTTPSATSFECPHCGRAFRTKAGRTLHSKARHPVEANAEVVVERVKPRWEAEERYLLAKREVELRRAGSRFLNMDLRNSFPARTLESIKGQRKRDEHKQLVLRLTQEAASAGGGTDVEEKEEDPRPTGSAPSTDGESEILEHLRKLIQKPCPRKFQSDILWDIAKQACEGEDVSCRLDAYLRNVFVCDRGPVHGRAGDCRARGPTSRRKRKRREYARMQELFRKRQGDCARAVLNGTPEVLVEDPHQLLAEWEKVMCPPAHEVTAPATAEMQEEEPSEALVNLFYPVTSQEVTSNLPPVKSAPGPDGFTARLLRTVSNVTLEVIMNLLALMKRVPESLRGARTVFIPKKSPAKCHSDFRPITVSSVLLRLYHRILAKRLLSKLDFDYRQRAFTPVDGCAENVFLLASVLEDAKQKLRPLHMASLDLSKAFDRVTTEAVIRGARRAGLNQEFLDYLQDVYEDSWTTLTLEGASRRVHPTVGVRQGDPLSPLLFNLMLDEFLQSLDPGIGYSSDQLQLDGMAFADDLIVFASTPAGLQERLDSLHSFVGARGLAINTEKSFTVSIVPSGREKRTKVVTTGNFSVSGIPLPACGIDARWKYLGVEFSPNGRNVPLFGEVTRMLERVAKAPLKPQQRLVILRFYLIPRLYHRLVLGKWNQKLLKRLDVQIRDAVRKWMALPHDTPLGYFHAPVKEGGLGVGSFSTAVPWMQGVRLSRMATSSSPICRQAAETHMVKAALGKAEEACRVRGNILSDKQSVEKHWSALLHASNDGAALREVRQMPAAQRWIQEGTGLLTGRAFIDVNKLRINALPVKTRTKRGKEADKNCRGGCRVSETLDHVLQKCHRTHAARIKRHDGLVELIVDRLRKKGWTVEKEKRFQGPQTLIPDIVARRVTKDSTASDRIENVVIDATVITCGIPLLKAHEGKVRKYDVPQVTAICKGKSTEHPLVTSATLNFRGVWCRQSAQDLLSLGLTKQDLKILSVRCLQGGMHCFRVHQGMTSVSRRTL